MSERETAAFWLRGLRIGYVPYAPGCESPGDRRRFSHYAQLRGIPFEEHVPGRPYDLVYVTSHADISSWRRTPRQGPLLVYEMIDSYLAAEGSLSIRDLARAPAKSLLGEYRHFEPSFINAVKGMAGRADVVVCSTEEQRSQFLRHNPNVHAILDFHTGEQFGRKASYARRGPLRLVWDGLPGNLDTFRTIAPALERLATRVALEVHVVTQLRYRPVNGPVPWRSTRELLRRVLPGVTTFLYEWNPTAVSAIARACDVAVIPMRLDSAIHRAKPENKLLFFWRLGLPVVTAATPAYRRAMSAAGGSLLCADARSWEETLISLAESETRRAEEASKGVAFVETEHSEERTAARWDAMFATLATRELVAHQRRTSPRHSA